MNIKSNFNKLLLFLYENFPLVIFFTILIISIFALPEKWVKWINILWVSPIMSKTQSYECYLSMGFLFCLIIYYYHKFRFSEALDETRIAIICIYTTSYIICYHSDKWTYSIVFWNIPWSHLTLIPSFFELILGIKIHYDRVHKEQKAEKEESQKLYAEKVKDVADTFGRTQFIETTFQTLKTCFYDENSFSVAITGSWGSGKTTFLNSLKKTISQNDLNISILNFEPWKNDSPESIMKSFFSLLSKELNNYIPLIRFKINKYVSILIDETPKDFKLVARFFQTILSNRAKTSPFEKIHTSLKKSKHKVLIFIDDIDRLEAKEIKEILRLIRNTANFPYLQFIVAFDKEYVIKSLNNSGINNATSYLEKFFNLEIGLPSIQDNTICSEIKNRIYPIIKSVWKKPNSIEINNMVFYRTEKPGNSFVNYFLVPNVIRNQRDVFRFINSYRLTSSIYKQKKIEKEISFRDLFFVELLRYKFYVIYMLLYKEPLSILKEDEEKQVYILKENAFQGNLPSDYTKYEKEICTNIIQSLLKGYNEQTSFCYVRNFARYFMVHMDEKVLSISEFLSLTTLSEEDLVREAIKLYQKKSLSEFSIVIYNLLIQIRKNKGSYQSLYTTLGSLCKQNLNIPLKEEVSDVVVNYVLHTSYESSSHLQSILQLLDKTYNKSLLKPTETEINNFFYSLLYKQNLTYKLNENFDNNVPTIIRTFLEQNKHPLVVSKAITTFINLQLYDSKSDLDLVINLKYLKVIQIKIFKHFNRKISNEGILLFRNCMINIDNTNARKMKDMVLNIMRKAIDHDPESYLKNFVQPGDLQHNSYFFAPDPYYLHLFKTHKKFDIFISRFKNNPNTEKAYNFWRLYKNNGYNNILVKSETELNYKIQHKFKDDILLLDELLQIENEITDSPEFDKSIYDKFNNNHLDIKLREKIEQKFKTQRDKTPD